MPVLTPENITSFAGLNISKEKAPTALFLSTYGVGGSGKTTLLSEIVMAGVDGAPALLVDIDRSSGSVVHLQDKGLNILKISSWAEAAKIRDEFKKGSGIWKSVIIDNMSELLSLCVKHYAPRGMPEGSNAIKIWGMVTADVMEFVRDMRTFCSRDGTNLLMSLWEETEKDDLTERIRIKVMLSPKLSAAYPGMSTMVGRLTVVGNEKNNYIRLLDFAPTEKLDNKWRVAPTDVASGIPLQLYLRQHSGFVADLLATVKHGEEFPIEKYRKP